MEKAKAEGESEVGAGAPGKTYWLIEYREDGRTVGYLKDLRRGEGGFDAYMTRDASQALRFDNKESPQLTINDEAFQRTVPYADRFCVEAHVDCGGTSDYDAGYEAGVKHTAETWRALVKSVSETARLWAVSMGGNTPLALISMMLVELVEPAPIKR